MEELSNIQHALYREQLTLLRLLRQQKWFKQYTQVKQNQSWKQQYIIRLLRKASFEAKRVYTERLSIVGKGFFYPLHEVLAGLDQSLVVCLLHDAEERVIPKPELSTVNSMTALRRLSSGYWGSRQVEQVSALLWFLLSINERGGIKPLPQVYNRFKEHAQYSIVKRDIQFAHMAESASASWLPANASYEFVFRSADISPVNRVIASAQGSPKETCLAHLNIFMLLYTDGLMGMRRDFLDRCYVDAFSDVGVKEPGSLVMNIANGRDNPKIGFVVCDDKLRTWLLSIPPQTQKYQSSAPSGMHIEQINPRDYGRIGLFGIQQTQALKSIQQNLLTYEHNQPNIGFCERVRMVIQDIWQDSSSTLTQSS